MTTGVGARRTVLALLALACIGPAQAFDLNVPMDVFDELMPGQYADMKVGERLSVFGIGLSCHDGSTLKIVATSRPYISSDASLNAFVVTKESDYTLSLEIDVTKFHDPRQAHEFVEQIGRDRCGALMELEARKLRLYDVTWINGAQTLTQLIDAIVSASNGGLPK